VTKKVEVCLKPTANTGFSKYRLWNNILANNFYFTAEQEPGYRITDFLYFLKPFPVVRNFDYFIYADALIMRNAAIIIIFILYSFNVLALEKNNYVSFNSKIDWSLFKGVPNADSLGARISTFIYLETSKINTWNGTISFKAYARMYPFESWVRPGYADEYTLHHEQTHFNITEICARGLQAELNQMKIKSMKSSLIQSTYEKWQIKREDLQKQYDFETKSGNDSVSQNLWNQKILAELNQKFISAAAKF
jgi:hypothetical protein